MINAKIMVVSESVSLRESIFSDLPLGPDGFLLEALSAAEALYICEVTTPDLLILPSRLTDMTGLDLMAALRRSPQLESKPILFLLEEIDREHMTDVFEAGVNDCLTSPWETTELRARVQALLRQSTRVNETKVLLHQEQERAQRYLDLAAVVVVGLDTYGRINQINQAGCALLGYDEEELLGKEWFQFLPKDSRRAEVQRVFKTLMQGTMDAVEYYENPIVSQNGQVHQITWRNTILRDPKGKICGTLSAGSDITTQAEAIQSLEESTERFQALFTHSLDGLLLVCTESYEIVSANPAATQLLGYPERELTLQTIDHLGTDHEDGAPLSTLCDQARNDGAKICERTLRNAGGDPLLVDCRLTAVSFGQRSFILVSIREIGEQRHMERRLHHSEKMKAIGQLAGGMAHDYNNVLSIILGYADFLVNQLTEGKPLKYAKKIQEAAQHSADLTQQLLTFSRQDEAEDLRHCDLHQIATQATTLLEHGLSAGVQIHLHLEAEEASILGNPSMIQNALINLCINAGDAMPKGGDIVIETELVTAEAHHLRRSPELTIGDRYLLLRLSDTGSGMDAQTQKRIFEPFFTTKGESKGTGLGLAGVYATLKAHHGAIQVDSLEGRGTTFSIFLPCPSESAPQESRHAATAEQRPHHILVVDDEAAIRSLISRILAPLGDRVTCCRDGEEGLAYYKRFHTEIDLAVIDMMMPKLNGYELFQGMRRINPELKVIVTSGFHRNQYLRSLLLNREITFLPKPFTRSEFLERYQEVTVPVALPVETRSG
ncbi:MAG: hybrid sensor histidine kinase/response regulator [Planctomycetota bacterium]